VEMEVSGWEFVKVHRRLLGTLSGNNVKSWFYIVDLVENAKQSGSP